jgi:signal transduction histidine kinase
VHEGTRGIGLLGMRERVTLVGGLLTVDSRPGRGTHIRIEVPWTA